MLNISIINKQPKLIQLKSKAFIFPVIQINGRVANPPSLGASITLSFSKFSRERVGGVGLKNLAMTGSGTRDINRAKRAWIWPLQKCAKFDVSLVVDLGWCGWSFLCYWFWVCQAVKNHDGFIQKFWNWRQYLIFHPTTTISYIVN